MTRVDTMGRPFEPSDALVFFGATGDLAYKKIFPALQALVRAGHGSTSRSSGWPTRAGAANSSSRGPGPASTEAGPVDGPAFEKLVGLLRYVDGDYNDPETFRRLRGRAGRRRAARPLPRHPARACSPLVVEQLARLPDCRRGRGSSWRSRSAATSPPRAR